MRTLPHHRLLHLIWIHSSFEITQCIALQNYVTSSQECLSFCVYIKKLQYLIPTLTHRIINTVGFGLSHKVVTFIKIFNFFNIFYLMLLSSLILRRNTFSLIHSNRLTKNILKESQPITFLSFYLLYYLYYWPSFYCVQNLLVLF